MFATNYTTIHCKDPDVTKVRARLDAVSPDFAHVVVGVDTLEVSFYGPVDDVETVLREALDRLAEARQPEQVPA